MPLVHGRYPVQNPEYLLAGNLIDRRNLSRTDAISDTATLATGVATSVAIALQAGDVVSKIAFKSGATAAGTPTHYAFGLYDPSGNLLAQTADQTSTAWAANTVIDLSLASVVTVASEGIYYASIFVAATTPPSLVGATLGTAGASTGILSTDKILSRTHGSALTTTFPATIAAATAVAGVPLVVLH
jgi:hypothetical protein